MMKASCGLLLDGVTIVKDSTTKALKVADGVVGLTIATDEVLGGVIPDGTVITVGETGAITVPDATSVLKGVVNQSVVQADSTATDVAGLLADFNTLLGNLQTAGVMATE